MPEGHTLHRLAGQFQRLVVGKPWRVTSPQGRFAAGAARLTERVPERAEAWGKQLFIHLGPDIWQVHLGLYGAFSFRGDDNFAGAAHLGAPRHASEAFTPSYDDAGWIIPHPPTGAVRARVHVASGWADLRGPARCEVLNPMQYETVIRRLGPDPLHEASGQPAEVPGRAPHPGHTGLEKFAQHLERRRISIAAALMDQSVIAGVGNIYRAESLFVCGINPDLASLKLSFEQIKELWETLSLQMRQGVEEGAIITLRPDDPGLRLRGADVHSPVEGTGRKVSGSHIRRHWVYQHQGTACLRCGAIIQMRELSGRRLYWCPGCQT